MAVCQVKFELLINTWNCELVFENRLQKVDGHYFQLYKLLMLDNRNQMVELTYNMQIHLSTTKQTKHTAIQL